MRFPLFAALFASALTFSTQSKAPACDRACLKSYVDRYLDAVIAHDGV